MRLRVLILLAFCLSQASHAGSIDVHMHFLDKSGHGGPGRGGRMMRSPGFNFTACADETVRQMDKYGVEKAVIMPPPMTRGQNGAYTFEEMLPAIKKYPDRLYLSAGGGTLNMMIHETPAKKVTDALRKRFREEAMRVVDAGAVAFGEMAALHISMNDHHVFEEVEPDHPLFLELADISAKHGIPIDFHMEPIIKYAPTPENLLKTSRNNPSFFKTNICGFERLLRHNRKAMIVWQHIGWDNVGYMTPSLIERLVQEHPNLYLGYKVESRLNQVKSMEPMPNRMVDSSYRFKPEWLSLIKRYPDRFLVATDQFVASSMDKVHMPGYLKETWTPTKHLPEEIFKKVARNNALRLYPRLNK